MRTKELYFKTKQSNRNNWNTRRAYYWESLDRGRWRWGQCATHHLCARWE